MTTFLQNFKDSSQEFKNVRSLVTAALLIALHTVLAYFVSFQVTPSLRISVSFLANVVTGAMLDSEQAVYDCKPYPCLFRRERLPAIGYYS